MSDIKVLLERAEQSAEGSGRSAVTTETVYAGAAKARRRRRGAVAGAVVAVVLAAVAAVPVLDGLGTGPKDDKSSVAAQGITPEDSRGREQAEQLGKVLTALFPNITKVEKEKAGPLWLPGQQIAPGAKLPVIPEIGPLDGHYLVTSVVEGEKRYTGLSFTVMEKETVERLKAPVDVLSDTCKSTPRFPVNNCKRQELPSGQTLTTWAGTGTFESDVPWTVATHALLTLPDGGVLLFADGQQAASDRAFALTRSDDGRGSPREFHHGLRKPVKRSHAYDFVGLTPAEIRDLVARPELLPPD
ncbi:hypothetical protein ACFYT4_29655 [Streptomyces sp. NPDC004609]|uniref:hypothetical protein n=1 Tax=Streptomyces sp. NPDC004609 TaxID=3364704 RepID=UPI0036C22F84